MCARRSGIALWYAVVWEAATFGCAWARIGGEPTSAARRGDQSRAAQRSATKGPDDD